jgi:hypothetical protein
MLDTPAVAGCLQFLDFFWFSFQLLFLCCINRSGCINFTMVCAIFESVLLVPIGFHVCVFVLTCDM